MKRGTKRYILTVEIDEGYDEFWEDVAAGNARQKVKAEVESCLADHGFVRPGCRVKVEDVMTIYSTPA